MWIQQPIDYNKHALWEVSHWGRKRKQFYGYAVNRESARDVYSKRSIIAVTELQIMEWHDYKHLDWISVRHDDDQIYKFKEGDFKRLRLQDIEDMLLLLVQGKLSNLTVEERLAFNVSLRMFTRSIVIQRRVEDLQLGVESYQKKLNLTRPDTYRSDLRRALLMLEILSRRFFLRLNLSDNRSILTDLQETSKGIRDKHVESLELGKNGSAFIQGEMPKKIKDPELFILPFRLGDFKPFDTLADLGSCVNLILLYLLKKFKIGLLEETGHVFGSANRTKSNPVGIVKSVEVHIGKLKLLDFDVIYMEKKPMTPLLIGREFLATVSSVINYRKSKIAVGEGITRLIFRVKEIGLGDEDVSYWTTLGKRKSYEPRPSTDGIGAQPPYYAKKYFMDYHLTGEWETQPL
nr:hypothetical protein [Tanacetum cinerariifolium]